MNKKLILILALAFVVGISAAAFAEVQNVKVGGDLTGIGFTRSSLDLKKKTSYDAASIVVANISGMASIARLKVEANLTENVDVTFRLLNERVWSSSVETGANTTAVDVNLAYVTLKEFMKPTINVPVNLTIGRQDVKLGSGLLIGAAGTNQGNTNSTLPLGIRDFSTRGAFDGIMGTIDLAPLTITTGFLKVTEGPINQGADNNIYIASGAYNLGEDYKHTVLEATYVGSQTRKNQINNIGGRVTSAPVENLNVGAEYVYQTMKKNAAGAYIDEHNKTKAAQAIILNANYALPNLVWKPSFGVYYTSLSDKWNVMQESLTPASLANLILPNTDTNTVGVSVNAKPMDDLALNLCYTNLSLYKKGLSLLVDTNYTGATYTMDSTKKALGYEVDAGVAYDYTSDVQFGLNYGLLKPGKAFTTANRKSASQVVGTMKVSF